MAGVIASYTHINATGTYQLKTGKGVLHRVVINNAGDWTVNIYDHATANANLIASIKPESPVTLNFKTSFSNGLRVVTSGSTAGDVTIIWE